MRRKTDTSRRIFIDDGDVTSESIKFKPSIEYYCMWRRSDRAERTEDMDAHLEIQEKKLKSIMPTTFRLSVLISFAVLYGTVLYCSYKLNQEGLWKLELELELDVG